MSIFGEVWVYSLVAFVLGVVLAWLFLVRPLRRRVRELEQLASMTDASRSPSREVSGQVEAGGGTRTLRAGSAFDDEDEIPPASHTTGFQPGRPAPEPAPAEVTQHITPHPSWPERDSLRDSRAAAGSPGYGAASPAAETGYYGAEPHEEPDHHSSAGDLTSFSAVLDGTLDPGPQAGGDGTHAPEETRISPQRGRSLFEPVSYDEEGGGAAHDEPSAPSDATMVTQPPTYAFGGPDAAVEQEDPEERTQILPKRQPRQGLRGGFEASQPIQPSLRPVVRREPADEEVGTQSGSLFEPTVAPSGPEPATRPAHAGTTPGPFGPGSALPRPDGGRPSDEFAVKASVTSLRYCTPDSPQFGDMVAEVWFRTAADAERVGFRPMG